MQNFGIQKTAPEVIILLLYHLPGCPIGLCFNQSFVVTLMGIWCYSHKLETVRIEIKKYSAIVELLFLLFCSPTRMNYGDMM